MEGERISFVFDIGKLCITAISCRARVLLSKNIYKKKKMNWLDSFFIVLWFIIICFFEKNEWIAITYQPNYEGVVA